MSFLRHKCENPPIRRDINPVRETIFPIFKQSPERPSIFDLVGTGFFIHSSGLFLTARHVLEDFVRPGKKTASPGWIAAVSTKTSPANHLLGNNYALSRIVSASFVDGRPGSGPDIGLGVVEDVFLPPAKRPRFRRVKLTTDVPAVGSKISTVAFPGTRVQNEPPSIYFDIDYSQHPGEIHEVYESGRDSVMLPFPCCQTSMKIKSGASGGPVFDDQGRVFAVNSTGFHNHNEDDQDISYISPIGLALGLPIYRQNITLLDTVADLVRCKSIRLNPEVSVTRRRIDGSGTRYDFRSSGGKWSQTLYDTV